MPRTLRRSTTTKPAEQEAVADVEESSAPARSSRRRTAADEKPATEEDEATPKFTSGWDGYEKARTESSDYAPEFNKVIDNEDRLFRFVDESPFAVYRQHWIERSGKRSFTCLDKGCPLCDDAGDRPSTKVAFNVIDLEEDEPTVKVWTVSQKVADIVKKHAQDKKTAPINRADLYWAVSKTGKKGGAIQTNLQPIKARDLQDDWDMAPLTEAELNDLDEQAYGPDSIDKQSRKTLEEIADELV